MKIAEVLTELQKRLSTPGPGRRFYIVTGTYHAIHALKENLLKKRESGLKPFSEINFISLSNDLINYMKEKGNLQKAIDAERLERYSTVGRWLKDEFEEFLTKELKSSQIICLNDLELIYGYELSLAFLWDWAVSDKQVIVLV
ncbi:MAG: hypothetical protein ACTSPG_10345, partial [Candidatus Hodarchaeales archaeon]